MSDDKHDDYNSRMLHERHAQKLRRINQRKGHCFIQESNDDEDDKDDEYNRVIFFMIGMLKICVALIKEKDVASFRNKLRFGRSGR